MRQIKDWPRLTINGLLGIYQKTFSGDHGWLQIFFPFGVCRFRPTCSEYARAAIKKYGLWRGGGKAVRRILRCHPWQPGGWDPLD